MSQPVAFGTVHPALCLVATAVTSVSQPFLYNCTAFSFSCHINEVKYSYNNNKEVRKMDLTINTAAAQIKLSNTNSAEKTQEVEKTDISEQTESAEQTTVQSRNFDTVDLSAQAVEYLNSTDSETASETSEADSTDTSSLLTSSSDDDSSDSVDALYTYTDDELADLLRDGAISQTEYNNEMSKRSAE